MGILSVVGDSVKSEAPGERAGGPPERLGARLARRGALIDGPVEGPGSSGRATRSPQYSPRPTPMAKRRQQPRPPTLLVRPHGLLSYFVSSASRDGLWHELGQVEQ
jgi:hypothetical protein